EDYYVFQILDRFDVAAASHHVLGAAQLDHAAAGLAVAAADRVDHRVDANVVALQAVRVDVDLILFAEPANRRHLGHAGHGIEVITQVPILDRTEISQAVIAGVID